MPSNNTKRNNRRRRRGAVFVFAVLIMVIVLGFAALVVDVGYLANARSELQRSADAAALAASWEYAQALSKNVEPADAEILARSAADATAAENDVCKGDLAIAEDDFTVGYLADLTDRVTPLDTSNASIFNAIEVRVRRNETNNGRVPFFFARIFGLSGTDAEASATAALLKDIRGFQTPANESNLHILPFALDLPSWEDALNGTGETTDTWRWDDEANAVVAGSDGIYEVNLYPKGNGSPGNRGTVDIGSSNNSTADIARQIVSGISAADLAHHGGRLMLDDQGELFLNGDTGISAGIKDELASIIGQPRIIPIFSEVNGPGNNAVYTIVKFAGVRILDVKLTGNKDNKRVIIQQAPIMTRGVIPSSTAGTSYDIYAPIVLVR